jgi:ATP-dependent Lhr-like helicase
VEEMAYTLNLNEMETRRAILDLVEEGIVDEGKFVIAEGTQYMLKRDHLRLRSSNLSSYDNRTVESYRRQKTHGPFRSIGECMRIIGEAGMPLDVFNRVEGFDVADWQEMRRNGELLLGRFMRGRVRYVLANEGPMYASMFRNSELSGLDNTILRELELSDGMTLRQLANSLEMDKEVLKEAVDRLDRNLYLVRKYEEGEDWARENIYIPYHPDEYQGDAPAKLVERYLRAYGPVQPYSVGTALNMMPTEVRERLRKLDVATISVGETRSEMVMLADELPSLDRFRHVEEGVRVVSLYDPDVQPMWAEIASRYGDGWIFPILADGRLVGAIEKWEMSGCTEVRSFDLDDPNLLPEALDAIDGMMKYYKLVGYDVVRIREVLGTPVNDLDEEIAQVLLSKGYIKLDGMYAKGNMVPLQVSGKDLFSYLFSKQHIGAGRRYPDEIEAVRSMGGLRSDAAAYLRSEVRVPLKKLAEQGNLIKVWAIPEYSTFTSLEHAALYRKVRNQTPSADMASLLRIIEEEAPISKHKLFDLSPVGHRRSYDALRALLRSTIVYADPHGLLRPVPDNGMEPHQAKKELMRMAFRNFGIFSAENLSRFLGFIMPMRELRSMLAELEQDGMLVKGFLLEGDDTMHWMLADDVDSIKGIETPDRFVLTSDDNLAVYLQYPWIRTEFGCTCNVIFEGVEMKAAYKSRTRGKDIVIVQFIGDREARRTLNDHIRNLGLTLRDEEGDRLAEWEIQEFFEKTHLGEED